MYSNDNMCQRCENNYYISTNNQNNISECMRLPNNCL